MDIRKLAVTLTIAILLAVFVNATISVFYKEPQYNDFCRDFYMSRTTC